MKRISLFISLLFVSLMLLALNSCTKEKAGTSGQSGVSNKLSQGAEIFQDKCAQCHGKDAKGGICPNLTDDEWIFGGTDEDIFKSISGGRPGGMPNWDKVLGEKKIRSVIAYIRSLHAK
jgi:cbb3-type cytochrome c oxidase subunit III